MYRDWLNLLGLSFLQYCEARKLHYSHQFLCNAYSKLQIIYDYLATVQLSFNHSMKHHLIRSHIVHIAHVVLNFKPAYMIHLVPANVCHGNAVRDIAYRFEIRKVKILALLDNSKVLCNKKNEGLKNHLTHIYQQFFLEHVDDSNQILICLD